MAKILRPSTAAAPDHYPSHRELVPTVPLTAGDWQGVVVVIASRPAHQLAPAAALAGDLGRPVVVLCSGRARPSEFAALATEWPGLRWATVDLPSGYRHPLLDFATSKAGDVRVPRLGDLSVKRNLGLLMARLAGWPSILFLDDDIDGMDPATVRSAAAASHRFEMVGLTVADYPDNSVVCHANRLSGGDQEVFVSGSALLVRTDVRLSFFPEIYNEDWLFFFDSLARNSVANAGSARQAVYNPFDDPRRAVAEEFGDILAEGLVSILHGRTRPRGALEAPYWQEFLRSRRDFISAAAMRLDKLPPDPRNRAALESLAVAEERRSAITADSLAAYVRTWRSDRQAWSRRLAAQARPHTFAGALRLLDLHQHTISSTPLRTSSAQKRPVMTATVDIVVDTPTIEPVPAPLIAASALVHDGVQIGVPYRRLRGGEWERLHRRVEIGADCELRPFSVIGEETVIGDDCILDSHTIVGGGATIGRRVIVTHRGSIGDRAVIGDDCVIGALVSERSRVADRCRVFGDLVHRQLDPTTSWDADESMESSPILEEGAFVGWGATVIGAVTVGSGAYVCAGATVTRDVPAGMIVTGTNVLHHPRDWKGSLGKSDQFTAYPSTRELARSTV